jgi:hypothetical protein
MTVIRHDIEENSHRSAFLSYLIKIKVTIPSQGMVKQIIILSKIAEFYNTYLINRTAQL